MSRPKYSVIDSLASLKLTVTLLALSIFLVLVGTLAQADHDIWFVVEKSYFRVWFAQVEFQCFHRLVELFTKAEPKPVEGFFWFPGGKLIGFAMMMNLVAAHSLRFKVSARGTRLAAGLGLTAIGLLATAAVLVAGMDDALQSQLSISHCENLWQGIRALVAGTALWGLYWVITNQGKIRPVEWSLALFLDAIILAVAFWLFYDHNARIDDAGLRILWQLLKATAATAILLVGCYLLFNKRAGIVLLHAGIGLLMIGEFITGETAQEGQMAIAEGETVNYTYDIRSSELAIITTKPAEGGKQIDQVTVIPESLLSRHSKSGELISHDDLPFDIRVKAYFLNSRFIQPEEATNLADSGLGKMAQAAALPSVTGVGQEMTVNQPSVYLELLGKESQESYGTWLASTLNVPAMGSLPPQPIETVLDKPTISLRFRRTYKPYSITLHDFRFDRYVGTETPKNFSSDITLADPSRGVQRDLRIWMNNPLRYGGDTLYQSSFDNATEKITYLQVVTNSSWMIPYISLMLVGIGMLVHFGFSLGRFVNRRQEAHVKELKKSTTPGETEPINWLAPTILIPTLVGLTMGAYLLSKARPNGEKNSEYHLTEFGQLPVAEGGRIKPFDTLARTTLQYLSERQVVLPDEYRDETEEISATQWLTEVISGVDAGFDRSVFRITNVELIEMLGLDPKPGFFRYTYNEILSDRKTLQSQMENAQAISPYDRTIVQNKTLELATKIAALNKVINAFGSPKFGTDRDKIQQQVQTAFRQVEDLNRSEAACAVFPQDASAEWITLFEAELQALTDMAEQREPNPATQKWFTALSAYEKEDSQAFNDAVSQLSNAAEAYENRIKESGGQDLAGSEILKQSKLRFEYFFQSFSPFYYCAACYLIAFFVSAASWLGLPRTLGRSATAIILIAFLVHTFALVARIYISGRPPVTNLYSSAVFIGWAVVLFGLILESIYRMGVGNAMASLIGFATLVIAQQLSLDGDTFTVMRAVLDTQFWLATHVVCITIGYAATFLAGFLGMAYILGQHLCGVLGKSRGDQVVRMIYGTLCFALLFSFVGTVLGGLWADDSWGRFWGWDPKENGALIIVLWNALVLHARWGKMARDNGLAILAVAGNITTAWSWFGVNELGVGLHSYGFTDGLAKTLLYFIISQLAIIAIGCAPIRNHKKVPVAE